MWPGFGENSRVLEWIFGRTDYPDGDEHLAQKSAIGLLPAADAINLQGLSGSVDMTSLFSIPKDFWLNEVQEIEKYFDDQVNDDLPREVASELSSLEDRVKSM